MIRLPAERWEAVARLAAWTGCPASRMASELIGEALARRQAAGASGVGTAG
jgi:hypothetical protein